MSEFTGKTRIVYEVRVTLSERREAEHESEGWVPMPADKPVELERSNMSFLDPHDAQTTYQNAKNSLLLP